MKRFSFVILVLCAIIKLSENYEQFDEKAWMERYELNKYFDYSDEKFQKHQTTTKVRMLWVSFQIILIYSGI